MSHDLRFRHGNVRFHRTGSGNLEVWIDGFHQPGWVDHADIDDLIIWLAGNGNGRARGRTDAGEGETNP